MSWCVLNTIPWVRLRSTTTRQNFGSNPATTTIPLSENPDISKKKTGTTTCIQRDFPWIKIPELSWSRRIAKKTDGIHHSYRIIKEGGVQRGGSLVFPIVSYHSVRFPTPITFLQETDIPMSQSTSHGCYMRTYVSVWNQIATSRDS